METFCGEVSYMEDRLVHFLKTNPSKISLSDFRRQYVGFTRGGKRYIYGNFYRASLPVTLKSENMEPVVVCDGGSSFWGIVFSVETKEFKELAFNELKGPGSIYQNLEHNFSIPCHGN